MRKVPFIDSLHIIGRGSRNWSAGRPSAYLLKLRILAPAIANIVTTAAPATILAI
jgi:hypothetical protein